MKDSTETAPDINGPVHEIVMTCLCSSWVREPEQTDGVLTRHHPQCPCFEGKKKYFKITLHGGGSYIQPIGDLTSAIIGETDGADPGTKWTLELLEMYEEQYKTLPEFQGH